MNSEGFDVLRLGTFPGLQLAAGLVPGVTNILVQGWNPTVNKTGTPEDLWMGVGGRISYGLPTPFQVPALADLSVRVTASSSSDLSVSSTLQIIEEVID